MVAATPEPHSPAVCIFLGHRMFVAGSMYLQVGIISLARSSSFIFVCFTFASQMFFAFLATAALSPQPPPSRAGRREVLFAVAAGSLAAPSALLSAPRQARASYAMYQGAPPQ